MADETNTEQNSSLEDSHFPNKENESSSSGQEESCRKQHKEAVMKQLSTTSESKVEKDMSKGQRANSFLFTMKNKQDSECTAEIENHASSVEQEVLEYIAGLKQVNIKSANANIFMKQFFCITVMLIFGALTLAPYILVFLLKEVATAEVVTTLIQTTAVAQVSAIIVLPKGIASYLFDKKEGEREDKLLNLYPKKREDKE